MFFRSKKAAGKERGQPLPTTTSNTATLPAAQASGTTGATAAVAAPIESKSLPQEEMKKRAEVSQRLATAIGEIVSLMMRSPRHRERTLSDLKWLVPPAVRAGQYALVSAQSKSHGYTAPVAAVLWARVSADVDKRLSEKLDAPIRLGLREWRSGDILWLIEAIGDDSGIAAVVQRLRQNEWQGKPVKARVTDSKGQIKVRLIEPQAAPNGAAGRAR